MKRSFYQDYYQSLTKLIPEYCQVSFSQDVDKIGTATSNYLIAAGTEFYLTGAIGKTLSSVGGNLDDQNLTQDVLEDFLQLYTNTNLLIVFCHRVEVLNKIFDSEQLVDRATLNQLNKLYNDVKSKLPFSVSPLTPLKKLKIKAGLNRLKSAVAYNKADEPNIEDIDFNEVRAMLSRIRTR